MEDDTSRWISTQDTLEKLAKLGETVDGDHKLAITDAIFLIECMADILISLEEADAVQEDRPKRVH